MRLVISTAGAARRWPGQGTLLALAGQGLLALTLAACASSPAPVPNVAGTEGQPSPRYNGYKVGKPYQVHGVWYYPKEQPGYDEIGIASWYGYQFHNQYTADGEMFDMTLPSAAHKTLPLPSIVEVTNLANGKKLVVRVNDRGPFVDGRIIDMSKEAAAELGFLAQGVTRVRVRYLGQAADPPGYDPHQVLASARRTAPRATSRPVELAGDGPPKRPIPYGQLDQATAASAPPATLAAASAAPAAVQPRLVPQYMPRSAPAPTTVASPVAPAALPDVDSLLADAAPRPAPVVSATYELQAGAFASEDAARRFASGLTGGGLPEVQTVHQGAQTSYRVVVHGLAGPAEAAAARSEAMALGAPSIAIVGGS